MNEDEMKCPFCAEIIKAEAKICRFCSRDLEDDDEDEDAGSPIGKPTKPAGCVLQFIGGGMLIVGLLMAAFGMTGFGIPLLVIGLGIVVWGGQAAR